eukprot:6071348-Amphidinium_carterae.1
MASARAMRSIKSSYLTMRQSRSPEVHASTQLVPSVVLYDVIFRLFPDEVESWPSRKVRVVRKAV